MPWSPIQLVPGVNTQKTLSDNQAGVSQSQAIRYKDNLIQTLGGWINLFPSVVPSTVRDIHAWEGIGTTHPHLSLAGTQNLTIYHSDNGALNDITPQTNVTNPPVDISISAGTNLATIVDGGSSATTYNTVFFNTQIAIGSYLLSGAYKINSVGGSSIYTIVLPFTSTQTIFSSGILPIFHASSGSAIVRVELPNNNYPSITGLFEPFIAPSSVGGLTIEGAYQIAAIEDSTAFTINTPTQATTTQTAAMNNGNAQFVYYVTLGPLPPGGGFGSGGFGLGGFGTGSAGAGGVPGIPITATDWTQDNWGEVLLACPEDGPIYAWSPDSGFVNAQVITEAPFFNGGIFISMPQQILVAYRSVQSTGVQDPLVVRWSNAGQYNNWVVSSQTTAGSFHIPTGSRIIGGIQAPTQGIISTDVDVWSMQYVGGDVIFNFTRIGSGCGWIGSHACGILANVPYWMSDSNFFMLSGQGVTPIPCTVWDQIFQNLNSSYKSKIRCAVNSPFNEIMWLYPSANSTGENDSYAKVHVEGNEFEWDYGTMSRTAWADSSPFGPPIGAEPSGQIVQHEVGNIITGSGLPSFRTGWVALGDGQDFPFVDMVIPDFKWGTQSGLQDAQISLTFFATNYLGDQPDTFGPYIVTSATEYINVRFRARFVSVLVQSVTSEFWRLGRIRFRMGTSGRR